MIQLGALDVYSIYVAVDSRVWSASPALASLYDMLTRTHSPASPLYRGCGRSSPPPRSPNRVDLGASRPLNEAKSYVAAFNVPCVLAGGVGS